MYHQSSQICCPTILPEAELDILLELHGYRLHMGAGWAAESLAPRALEGTPGAQSHDCSIARSRIEQPCHN